MRDGPTFSRMFRSPRSSRPPGQYGEDMPNKNEQQQALATFTKLLRCTNNVCSDVHNHLIGELSVSQFGILEALYHLGPMCQKELAGKLLKSPGNITTIINNLQRDGLVIRAPFAGDKRYYTIELTPRGRSVIERLFPRHAEIVARRFSTLTAKEQQVLSRLLKKLANIDS